MPTETRTFAQRFKDSVSAGKSKKYIEDVNNGKIPKARVDKVRLDSCWKAVDKCVGNPPIQAETTHTHQLAGLTINHPKQDD